MNRTLSEVLFAVLHAMGRPAAIAALLGVSRQRALQLLAKHGLGSIAAALKWATTATPEAKQRRKNRGTNTSHLKQKAKWRREGLCLGGGCPRDDGYLYCSAHGNLPPCAGVCQHGSVATRKDPVFFMGAADACALAGITLEQLSRWQESGVFRREQADGDLYSFRDVVGLRTLGVLRNKGVSLQHLRQTASWIRENFRVGTPWASLRFYVVTMKRKRKGVYFTDPDADHPVAGPGGAPVQGQYAFKESFSVEEIASVVASRVSRLARRPKTDVGRVTRMQGVVDHEPIIGGTRIPVRAIQEFHQAGYSVADILREYPQLRQLDVEAALGNQPPKQHRKAG